MAMIKLEHVNKYFGDLHVLKDINLEVAEGENWSLLVLPVLANPPQYVA